MLLFGQGLEEAEAQDLITEAGPLFAEAAYTAAQLGDLVGMLSLLTEGKARLLRVALRQQSLELPPEKRARHAALRAEIREWKAIAEKTKGTEGVRALEQLIALRRELGDLVAAATAKKGAGDAIAVARSLVPEGGALVAPIVTMAGGKILIVGSAKDGGAPTVVDLPGLTTAHLDEVMSGPADDTKFGGWFGAFDIQYLPREERQARSGVWLAAIDALGPKLWRLVGGPIHAELVKRCVSPGARILWLPTGALGLLPLGLAQDPATGCRLGDIYEIAFTPSLDALAAAARQIAEPIPRTLTAVANPTDDLAFTEIEVRLVAGHFDRSARTTLERGSATGEAVLAALGTKTYWHFASHGTFNWRDARQSGLLMAGKTPLTIGRLLDAAGLGRPRLVVLSACETGLYDIYHNPDEFVGLPGTFVALGAAGVLGTLWQVDDRATALLMAKFYDLHLGEGLSPPTALQRAQAWLRAGTKMDLVAYAKAATANGRIDDKKLSKKLETSLMRGQHEDPRFAAVWKALQEGVKAGSAEIKSKLSEFSRRKDAHKVFPFSHPYYWGGFIYTGL